MSSLNPAAPDLSSNKLPQDWRLATLDDACEFLDSRRIPVNQTERLRRIAGRSESDLYPYYGATGQVGWIDDYLFDEPLILLAEDGADFGSRLRPIAYAAAGRFWVNNHAHVLRPKPGVDFDFLLHSLMIRPDVGDLVSGSTRAKLGQAVAKRIPVLLPPLPEQKRIAVVLRDQLDAAARLRATADAEVESMQALAAATFEDLLRRLVKHGCDAQRCGDIALVTGGIQKSPLRVPRSFHRPFLTVRNVKQGYLDLSDVERMELTPAELRRLMLRAGDLLVVEGNGSRDQIGRNALFRGEIDECVHQNHVIRVRVDEGKLRPEFLSLYLNSRGGMAQLLQRAMTTTGLYTLSVRKIQSLDIPLPGLSQQDGILREWNRLQHELGRGTAAMKSQALAARELPAALLCRAFLG